MVACSVLYYKLTSGGKTLLVMQGPARGPGGCPTSIPQALLDTPPPPPSTITHRPPTPHPPVCDLIEPYHALAIFSIR